MTCGKVAQFVRFDLKEFQLTIPLQYFGDSNNDGKCQCFFLTEDVETKFVDNISQLKEYISVFLSKRMKAT